MEKLRIRTREQDHDRCLALTNVWTSHSARNTSRTQLSTMITQLSAWWTTGVRDWNEMRCGPCRIANYDMLFRAFPVTAQVNARCVHDPQTTWCPSRVGKLAASTNVPGRPKKLIELMETPRSSRPSYAIDDGLTGQTISFYQLEWKRETIAVYVALQPWSH